MNIEFSKKLSELKRKRKISECFYHDKSECKGAIKQAHSLQRNGRLSIIEGDVKGQKQIYTFTSFESDQDCFLKTLKPIGKAEASTFFGFCDFHDTNLFSCVEGTNKFDESDKHCFLHSYRSFAHSYHRKKEEIKLFSDKEYIKGAEYMYNQSIVNSKLALRDLEKYKQELDNLMENQIYDGLCYYVNILPELFPIACSSAISPLYTPKDRKIIPDDINGKYSTIIITILPDTDQTIIIFAYFPDDLQAEMYIDDFESLNDYQFRKALSSLLISKVENTFFSPDLWRALDKKGQKILCKDLETAITTEPSKFLWSKTNLFNSMFSDKRLRKN